MSDITIEQFRDEVQFFLDANAKPRQAERGFRWGEGDDRVALFEEVDPVTERQQLVEAKEWRAARFDAGLGWISGPRTYGGRELPSTFDREYQSLEARYDVPNQSFFGIGLGMVAPTILAHATDQVKDAYLTKMYRGDLVGAQLFSEPGAGSDLAGLQMQAQRDGDEWVLNGQKVWTSGAQYSDIGEIITRTDPDKPKHKGLTMFLVPLDSEGFEAQAVWTLSGERTNITFYSDVRISDEWRIGEVDGGWQVLGLSLQDEHASGWGPHISRLLEHAEQWAATPAEDGSPHLTKTDVRRRIARVAMEDEVSRLLQRRCVWMISEGQVPVAEGPMSKVFSTEALVRASQDIVELVGPDSVRSYFEPTAPEQGRFEHLMRFSLGTTIYAGTSEVQRSIIAQRGLGLPR
jgi:alkylation response protein AidB-like acyl-CoA dehydrogenase